MSGYGHSGGGHYGHHGDSGGYSGHHGGGDGLTFGDLLGLDSSSLGHMPGVGGHHPGHYPGHHCDGNILDPTNPSTLPLMGSFGAPFKTFLGMKVPSIIWPVLLLLGLFIWFSLISFIRHQDPQAKQIFWDANKTPPPQVIREANAYSGANATIENSSQKQVDLEMFGSPESSMPVSSAEQNTLSAHPNIHPAGVWSIPDQTSLRPRLRIRADR